MIDWNMTESPKDQVNQTLNVHWYRKYFLKIAVYLK